MNQLETKLYDAVTENNTALLSELLKEQGVNINFKTQNGSTLLHYVKSPETVEILMNAGIDWTVQDNDGMTAFAKNFERVYIKSYELVLLAMLKKGVNINAPAYFDEAPVIKISNHAATLSANIEQLQFLEKNGADLNIKNSQGYTPLMLAVIKNNIDMVHALLNAGADTAITDSKGRTAKEIGLSLIDSGYFIPALKTIINDM